jgi:hypothetical protein
MNLLVEVFLWSAVVYGVAMIVTTFKLFAPVRDRFPKAEGGAYITPKTAIGTLLSCTPCFATWVAMTLATLGYSPLTPSLMHLRAFVPTSAANVLAVFASGMAGAALAWTWRVVLAKLGSQTL